MSTKLKKNFFNTHQKKKKKCPKPFEKHIHFDRQIPPGQTQRFK